MEPTVIRVLSNLIRSPVLTIHPCSSTPLFAIRGGQSSSFTRKSGRGFATTTSWRSKNGVLTKFLSLSLTRQRHFCLGFHQPPLAIGFSRATFFSDNNNNTPFLLLSHHHHPRRQFHLSSRREKRDYYEVLGVSKSATTKDIKKAYLEKAKKLHPDANPDDPSAGAKFQEVSEAYEVLSDDSKKSQYDMYGMAGDPASASGGAGGSGAGGNPFAGGFGNFGFQGYQSETNPEDLFRKIFGDMGGGGGGFGRESVQGSTQEIVMDLSFQEAARGVNKKTSISVVDLCPSCKGNRTTSKDGMTNCTRCGGSGTETFSQGPFFMRSTCRQCQGQGSMLKDPCRECFGKGRVQGRKEVTVPVPAGVEDGQTIRMSVAETEVYVILRVASSDHFRREGADVHSDVKISVAQSVLGGSIRVRGIYENLDIDIPSGTGSHKIIKLSNKGLARVNSYGHGDHYLHVKIHVPTKLTEMQQSLMEAYAQTEIDRVGNVKLTEKSNANSSANNAENDKNESSKTDTGSADDEDGIMSKIKKKLF